MPAFTDKKGRVWEVEMDILAGRRVDSSDFTLFYDKPFSIFQLDQSAMQKLFSDASFMFAVIWAIVYPQRTNYPTFQNLNDEDASIEFVSGINAKAKSDGQQALLTALADFFPELKTGLSMLSQAQPVLREKMEKGLGEAMPILEEIMDKEMNKAIAQLKILAEPHGVTS